jgi:Uma2 family endonuclease
MTPEQYLEIERAAEFRSEYYNGQMFAREGANEAHNLLAASLISGLSQQLRSRPCLVLPSLMRIGVSPRGPYVYADVSALCGKPRFLDDQTDTLLNPGLIVEILSRATEAYDRGRKFESYKSIESLREYLLVASDRIHADLYTRQADGRWLLTSADKPEDSLSLESVGAELNLADLYDKVNLSAA